MIFAMTTSISDGHYHYELRDPDGNVLVSGPGNELTYVLLGMAVGWKRRRTTATTMPNASPRTCSDCGRELEDLSQPCRNCGSTRQTAYIQTGGSVVPSGAVTEYTVTYSGDRPWFGRWYGVRQELEKVEAECRPEAYRGGLYIVAAFENFFWQCFHFGRCTLGGHVNGPYTTKGDPLYCRRSRP
jgi:hypothetical protein